MDTSRLSLCLKKIAVFQLVTTGIYAHRENGGLDMRRLQQKNGNFVNDYDIKFDKCIDVNIKEPTSEVNIICQYNLFPLGTEYESILLDVGLDGECNLDAPPSPYAKITERSSSGKTDDESTLFELEINIDNTALIQEEGTNEFTFSVCIKNSVITRSGPDQVPEPFLYLATKVDITYLFGGGFGLNIEVLPEDDEGNISNYEFLQQYGIDSYQCNPEPPYERFNDPIKRGDRLAACVVADSSDTFIDRVETFTLDQESFQEIYIQGFQTQGGRAMYDCSLKKEGSDIAGSMCVIIVLPAWDYFERSLVSIIATGKVELRITESRKRALSESDNVSEFRIQKVLNVPYFVPLSLDHSGAGVLLKRSFTSIIVPLLSLFAFLL